MVPDEGPAGRRQRTPSAAELAAQLAEVRAREAERTRLLTMARETGMSIREHLRVEDLVREARMAIEENLDCDHAYLHLVADGKLGPPVGHEQQWLMDKNFLAVLGQDFLDTMRAVLRSRTSIVIQDVEGREALVTPPRVLERLRAAGIASFVLVPFGSGRELLGLIVAVRLQRGRRWTAAEVAAIEWIAADLGRGLHQARLYEEENRLVEQLQAVDSAKTNFLATASHELRLPLTSIAGFLELLADDQEQPLSPAQQHMVDVMSRNIERLRSLTENLLTLSTVESGVFRPTLRPVELPELVTAAVAAVKPQAQQKGVALASHCPEHLTVNGDPGQLDRVLTNLLTNAIKFTPPGGNATVEVTAEDGMAVVRVADSGIGIPERDQSELFTRFFRASNAVERAIPGTGLGLAAVQSIVASHGGMLRLVSREGQGTTVTVQLPLPGNGGGA